MNLKRLESLVGITLALGLVAGAGLHVIPYSLTETLGFVTGATCVYLVVKRSIWNFPVGIANNLFFIVLFAGARLYGDAALQLVYIGLGVQGWYLWLHGGQNRGALNITRAPIKLLAVILFLTVTATIGLAFILRAARGSLPVLDALTTVLSLAAQYLLNKKYVENWYVWITADVLYIYVYVSKGLTLTAILYAVFLALCVAGVRSWLRALREGRAAQSPHPATEQRVLGT